MEDRNNRKERESDDCSLITKKKLAEMLSVSPRTLQRMLSAGKIPSPVQLGRKMIRWRVNEIKNWIAAGCPICRRLEGGR